MTSTSRSRGQGTTGPRGRSNRSRRNPARVGARPAPAPLSPAAVVAARPRSRFTGRTAVLVLVLAVLTVSYASSMRAYLQQRTHINSLKSQIAQHNANIDALENEKQRWADPAYVEAQARLRLGYVMPGEKTYLVLDQHGNPVESQASLDSPAEVRSTTPTPWWSDAWGSVELAGHPPAAVSTPQPATKIDGSHQK
jgi:cell division protein FtsB